MGKKPSSTERSTFRRFLLFVAVLAPCRRDGDYLFEDLPFQPYGWDGTYSAPPERESGDYCE